jgi:hypothetical protein
MKIIVGLLIVGGLAWGQTSAVKLPELSAEDGQAIQALLNPQEITAVKADLEKTQALANALQGQLNALYTIQQMKLGTLLTKELPEKYKVPDYVFDPGKGWVKKTPPTKEVKPAKEVKDAKD